MATLDPADSEAKRGAPSAREPEPALLAARRDSLFTTLHPVRGTRRLRSGAEVAVPFHGYDADALILHGTADLAALAPYAEDVGLHAIASDGGKGIASLWLVDYADTNLGVYREVVLMLAATRVPRRIPWRNAMTAVAPQLMNGVELVSIRLLLPEEKRVEIDYGRELLALDKRPASTIRFDRPAAGPSTFEVTEGGKLAVRGVVHETRGPVAQARAGLRLTTNVGAVSLAKKLGQRVLDIPVRSALDGRRAAFAGHLVSRPKFTVLAPHDTFEAGGESDFGRLLRALAFTPTAASRDPHLRFVLDVAGP